MIGMITLKIQNKTGPYLTEPGPYLEGRLRVAGSTNLAAVACLERLRPTASIEQVWFPAKETREVTLKTTHRIRRVSRPSHDDEMAAAEYAAAIAALLSPGERPIDRDRKDAHGQATDVVGRRVPSATLGSGSSGLSVNDRHQSKCQMAGKACDAGQLHQRITGEHYPPRLYPSASEGKPVTCDRFFDQSEKENIRDEQMAPRTYAVRCANLQGGGALKEGRWLR
jgi:hypothetical protein